MKLTTLARGEHWMDPTEFDLNRKLVGGIAKLLKERGVKENPLLALRVNELTVTWLVSRRVEAALAPEEDTAAPRMSPAQAEAIGKARERLRKAVRELEEYCERAGTPIDRGLADLMKPVIQQIQGPNPFFGPSEHDAA